MALKLVFIGLLPLAALATSDLADDAVCSDCSPERAEAFVQHKRSRGGAGGKDKDKGHAARKGSHCDGEKLRDHCPRSGGQYLDYLKKPAAVLDEYKPRMGHGEDLLEELRISDPESWDEFREARKSFDALRHVDARKVLAFQETWTSEDSTMLKKMASLKDAWVPGKFDHEKFKKTLPSVSILQEILDAGNMAIVGAGSSLTRKGDDIDGHPTVVRFNNHIGSELLQRDTGEKMTVHVMNGLVDFNPEKGVVHMDLESTNPGSSMCKRWHNQKKRTTALPKDQVTLLFRPTAVCGLPESMASFTRGFLFYWLVGRLAEHSDNYGMGLTDGQSHRQSRRVSDNSMVNEPFVEFEHALYNAAERLEAKQAAEKKAADEAKAAKAAAKAAEEAKAAAEAKAAEEAKAAAEAKAAEEAKAKAAALQQVDNTTAAAAITTKADAPAPTTAAAAITTKADAPAPTTAAAEKAKTDAATTAASPAATTAAAAAATTAAAEKAATTAAASETTAGVVKTTAAPAVATTTATEAPKQMKAKESNDTAEAYEETEDEPESAEDEESKEEEDEEEEEEEEDEEEEEEEEEEETTTRKPTKKKHTKHHHQSGASHSSAFTLAAIIAAATWMLHM